jgi:EAL domain-containing protein (putative c-di-GMP-specific phosphodiesterase class I)
VAVNVSALQFRSGGFAERVRRILAEEGLAPHHLELELTETVVMREAEAGIDVVAALKEMGVRLAIDDFGTGFSSLSYLGRLPIDRLKIDRSFVRDLTTATSARAIASAVVGLARSLGIGVIAEGVETDEQAGVLEALGCEEMQGYLVAAPLDSAATRGLLAAAPARAGA